MEKYRERGEKKRRRKRGKENILEAGKSGQKLGRDGLEDDFTPLSPDATTIVRPLVPALINSAKENN